MPSYSEGQTDCHQSAKCTGNVFMGKWAKFLTCCSAATFLISDVFKYFLYRK